jgi:nucleotide-binding universal stress UspA family protein
MEYRHILIATDGSHLANQAVLHGLALAKRLGSRVTAVTVTEMWSAMDMAERSANGEPRPTESFQHEAEVAAQQVFAAVKELAKSEGIACDTIHVSNKRPAEGIIETASDLHSDMIVMSSHGRRGIEKMLLGSQAAEVLARSKVPVLICR